MLHRVPAAALEHIEGPDDVALHVAVRILERIAHAGLRAQVHDPLEALPGEQGGHRLLIGEVGVHKSEQALPGQEREARTLERRIVVVVEIVQPDHFVAAPEEPPRGR